MSLMPPAGETVPDYQPAPPDAQPMTLQEHLDGALAIMAEDRILDPQEMAAVSNFLSQVRMLGERSAQMGGQPGMPGAPGQPGDPAAGGPRETTPYGQSQNPNVSYAGGQ